MTLVELNDAVDGHKEERKDQYNELSWNARLIAYYAAAPHVPKKAKIRKPEDLFDHAWDKEIKRQRLKKIKPIQRVPHKWEQDGKQSNGKGRG
jgi:hypothetical protein